MRRIYISIFMTFLLSALPDMYGQNLYVANPEARLGKRETLSLQKRVDKPGMSASELYRAFYYPKYCRSSIDMGLNLGFEHWNTLVSKGQLFFDVAGVSSVSYRYFVYTFDGYYIISLEDIFIQKNGHHFTLYGNNGMPFKDEYSRRDYKIALNVLEFIMPKFEQICTMLEEKAFPVLAPAD